MRLIGKTQSILLFLFITSLLTRLFLLDQIPVSLTHDELVYAVQAKSLAETNHTLNQKLSWFSLQPIDPLYSEWPASILAIAFTFIDSPLLATHIIPALMGATIPFLLGLLVWSWWKDRQLSVLAVAVSVFNPFLWQFSRLSYDALYSSFFYLAGAAVLLLTPKAWKLFSLPLFVLGFFQYQGLKLLLLPWIVGVLLLQWLAKSKKPLMASSNPKIRWRSLITHETLVIATCCLLVGWYATKLLPLQDVGNRLNSLIWHDTTYLSRETNTLRRLSFDSPFITILVNKLSVMTSFVAYHLFGTFNPVHLFSAANPTVNGFAAWRHGWFYLLDAFLIAVGFLTISLRPARMRSFFGLLIFILVLSTPALINTMSEWYELRAFLAYLLIPIIIAFGMQSLNKYYMVRVITLTAYILSVAVFAHHYFIQYPVYAADQARISERVVARYATIYLHKQMPLIIVTDNEVDQRYFYYALLLYSSSITKSNAQIIADSISQNTWQLGSVSITSKCISLDTTEESTVLFASGLGSCDQDPLKEQMLSTQSAAAIPMIVDSGALFKVYNDKLCARDSLSRFISPKNFSYFDIENQDQSRFCQNWFIKTD